jgi:DNA replication licensing factor MCM4
MNALASSDSEEEEDATPIVQAVPPFEVENANAPPVEAMEENEAEQRVHIRGTDIHVPTAAATFTHFLRHFRSLREERDDDDSMISEDSDDAAPPLYLSKLTELGQRNAMDGGAEQSVASLALDMMHLYYHNAAGQQLYRQIVQHPMELIPLLDLLLQQELERLLQIAGGEAESPIRIQVRPYNLKVVSNLRQLDPIAMDTLICCKGMIVRTSSIIPDLKVAHFGCTICGHAVTSTIDRGRITEPTVCPNCQTRAAFQLQHNRSVFADKQLIRLQETPDEVPAGQTPASVLTLAFDDLVDTVVPGDKVEITGILRAQPVRVHPKLSKLQSLYKTYLDVIHFHKITGQQPTAAALSGEASVNAATMNATTNVPQTRQHPAWTPARIQQLRQWSQDPQIYQKLTASLAPSIWELDHCKQGILCMLFGGNTRRIARGTAARAQSNVTATNPSSWLDDDEDSPNASTSHGAMIRDPSQQSLNKRGDINILLCGDPGTSKSQLLSYVHKLCTRGIYTSGKGSSAVGLTASVVRDPETREHVLESGALVLSDLGICCIDEFDKMSDATRSVLHEAMEQQTVRAFCICMMLLVFALKYLITFYCP